MADVGSLLDRAIIAYYGFDDPIMSDEEFDALFTATYDPDAEPLERYRAIFGGSGRRRALSRPMLSLSKVKSAAALTAWIDKVRAAGADGIWVAPKYDGLADRHQRIATMPSTPGPMPRDGAWRNPGIPRLQAVGRMSNSRSTPPD